MIPVTPGREVALVLGADLELAAEGQVEPLGERGADERAGVALGIRTVSQVHEAGDHVRIEAVDRAPPLLRARRERIARLVQGVNSPVLADGVRDLLELRGADVTRAARTAGAAGTAAAGTRRSDHAAPAEAAAGAGVGAHGQNIAHRGHLVLDHQGHVRAQHPHRGDRDHADHDAEGSEEGAEKVEPDAARRQHWKIRPPLFMSPSRPGW